MVAGRRALTWKVLRELVLVSEILVTGTCNRCNAMIVQTCTTEMLVKFELRPRGGRSLWCSCRKRALSCERGKPWPSDSEQQATLLQDQCW